LRAELGTTDPDRHDETGVWITITPQASTAVSTGIHDHNAARRLIIKRGERILRRFNLGTAQSSFGSMLFLSGVDIDHVCRSSTPPVLPADAPLPGRGPNFSANRPQSGGVPSARHGERVSLFLPCHPGPRGTNPTRPFDRPLHGGSRPD